MNKKKITTFELITMCIGTIIGSGLFSMLGVGLTYAGRALWVAMLLGMLLVILQKFREFFFSATFDLPGGIYDYNALTLTPVVIGTTALYPIFSILSQSVTAMAAAQYLALISPFVEEHQQIVAVIIATIFFVLSMKGLKFMAVVQKIMVICLYVALGLFVIYGIMNIDASSYAGEPVLPGTFGDFMYAAVIMSWVCMGADSVIGLAKNVEDSRRRMPKALLIGQLLAVAVYMVLAYVATHIASYETIQGQNMGFIAELVMPRLPFLFFVVGGAVLALCTTLNGIVSSWTWPFLTAIDDGWLPAFLGKRTKNDFPYVLYAVFYVIIVAPIIFNLSIENVVGLDLGANFIVTLVANIVSWRVPEKYPKAFSENTLHFSALGYRICLVISIASCLMMAYFNFQGNGLGIIIANIVTVAIMFIYSHYRYKSGKVHLSSRDIYVEGK